MEPVSEKEADPVFVVSENPVRVVSEESSDDMMLGWIEIDGVLLQGFVQGNDNQEYLYVNADGTASDAGANFMDYRCSIQSDNVIIYGHSSRTSQILFTPLMNYLDQDFALNHSRIRLKMNEICREYELISVFLFHVMQPSEDDWMRVDFEKEFLFRKAVERLNARTMHPFDLKTGDQLLTLVTCNTLNHDERLILVAIKDNNASE